MLHHCDSCPDESLAREFLLEQLQNNNYSPSDSIKYKQWVSTDRSQLEDNEEDFDDFLTKLLSMLFQLREHHFIAKSQSNFSKKQKGTLNQDNCILVLAFTEYYSFVIQDCAQDFHWNNLQATIYPFVLYYVDPEKGTVCHKTFTCISNHMTHDTVAVYAFLQVLIKEHVKPRYPFIKKIIYFGDGSAAQCKNYKKFSNLLH